MRFAALLAFYGGGVFKKKDMPPERKSLRIK